MTTHGAAAALLDAAGNLTLPVLDYEFAGPDELAAEYDEIRPGFAESFTPRLPAGLNLGAQLFWQHRRFPEAFAKTTAIVTYPQYWSFLLSGVVSSEITSLGCHTDLWNFQTDLYSSLVANAGWLDKMPAVRRAGDVLGLVRPEVAKTLGIHKPVPVHCGIHDSNASLLPHLIERQPPFAVVSTGTWVIVCAPGAELAGLDPARDCLANIDAFGRPVASARFMGGREFSQLIEGEPQLPTDDELRRVLGERLFLLPAVVEGSGPFPNRHARWSAPRTSLSPAEQYAVRAPLLPRADDRPVPRARRCRGRNRRRGAVHRQPALPADAGRRDRPAALCHPRRFDGHGNRRRAPRHREAQVGRMATRDTSIAPRRKPLAEAMSRYAARWRLELA